ncbi:PadR family transcriptional regulator [Myxococcota bacterium]|nr:PadR family transcriptional regulator [Myxococcota bacterium]
MAEFNATAGTILGFLQDRPRNGWELTQVIERTVGHFWNTTGSQIYRELRTLSKKGLIEAGEVGPRDRRPFSITDSGREAFQEWISQAPSADLVRIPFLLTLFFANDVDPKKLQRYVRAERIKHEERLESFERDAERLGEPSVQNSMALALGFGLTYERAMLSWFDDLEKQINES